MEVPEQRVLPRRVHQHLPQRTGDRDRLRRRGQEARQINTLATNKQQQQQHPPFPPPFLSFITPNTGTSLFSHRGKKKQNNYRLFFFFFSVSLEFINNNPVHDTYINIYIYIFSSLFILKDSTFEG